MMKLPPHAPALPLHPTGPERDPHPARGAAPKADAPRFAADLDAAVHALPEPPPAGPPRAAAPHTAAPQPQPAQPSPAAPQADGKSAPRTAKSALAAAADHFDKIDRSDKGAEETPAGGKQKKGARIVDTGAAALSLMLRAAPLSPLPKEAGNGVAKSSRAAPVAVERAKASESQQASQPEAAAKKPALAQAAPESGPRPAATPQPIAAPREIAAPKETAAPAPALAAALQAHNLDVDPGMHLTLLQSAAHLSIQSGGGEAPLRLHLRVRDGVADVRLDAGSAVTFGARADELRSALAGQGLRLGSFEVPSSAQADLSGGDLSQRQRAPEAPPEAPLQPGARAPGPTLSPARAPRAGRIDVEA